MSAPAAAAASDQHVIDVGSGSVARPSILSFTNLTYTVKSSCPKSTPNRSSKISNGHRVLLNSISGEARSGETLAILGPSGAGKTTLIDALANRIAKGSLEGSVTFNGDDLLNSVSAYVMQNDLLFPMLTVEETLTFAAEFRLPRSLSPAKKKARVRALLDQLGLHSAANTIVGDDRHRGVSGGERRRVSIGTDIIHNPLVLFLDEPTSGLDSASAFIVAKALQRIARGGSVVVMSVHQPSSRILGLLDRLLFISRGQTIYFGSTERLPLYFSEYGHPIPNGCTDNQTEFVLDLVRELESSATGTKLLVEFNKLWQLKIAPDPATINSTSSELEYKKNSTFANPIWIEMLVLAKRSLTNASRAPQVFGVRLAGVVLTGFILASVFWKPDDTPKGVRERVSFFVFSVSTVFYACIDVLPASLRERRILARETAYNAYRRSAYVLSGAIVGLPELVVLSAAFVTTTFFAVGLAGGASGFFFFFLTIFASFWAGSSFVTFLSAVAATAAADDMIAYTVAVAHLGYFLLFSGFFINPQRIPSCWIWFHYLSLVKYPYQAAVQNEFGDGSRCFARGVQMFDGTVMGSMPEAVKVKALGAIGGAMGTTTAVTEESCLTTGLDVLEEEGVMDLSKWKCLWVTVAWGFFFRVLFYFALSFGSKNKRK